MWRIMRFIPLILIALPTISLAEDKKGTPPKSLAAEAAYLGAKGADSTDERVGWVSAEVTVTSTTGEKEKAKLHMYFSPDKDKFTGDLFLGCDFVGSRVVGPHGFELLEKVGKRYITITQGKRDLKANPNPKVIATLEYSIQSEMLTLKGGEIPDWVNWKADFTKAIVFKAARK